MAKVPASGLDVVEEMWGPLHLLDEDLRFKRVVVCLDLALVLIR